MSSEWLLSPDFEEYRKAEMRIGAEFIHEMWKNASDPAYIRGATEMLRKIIRLPVEMGGTEEERAKGKSLIAQAYTEVESRLLRVVINE